MNDRVRLTDGREGIVCYIGKVHTYKGVWYGIDLIDGSIGKHNGTIDGQTYFESKQNNDETKNTGIFVKLKKISSTIPSAIGITNKTTNTGSKAHDSPKRGKKSKLKIKSSPNYRHGRSNDPAINQFAHMMQSHDHSHQRPPRKTGPRDVGKPQGWKPPEYMNQFISRKQSSFLNEKPRRTQRKKLKNKFKIDTSGAQKRPNSTPTRGNGTGSGSSGNNSNHSNGSHSSGNRSNTSNGSSSGGNGVDSPNVSSPPKNKNNNSNGSNNSNHSNNSNNSNNSKNGKNGKNFKRNKNNKSVKLETEKEKGKKEKEKAIKKPQTSRLRSKNRKHKTKKNDNNDNDETTMFPNFDASNINRQIQKGKIEQLSFFWLIRVND